MKKARILVCDDEMLIRLWLVEHLTEEGYRAEGVGDAPGLLVAMDHEPADLLLLDLRLPEVSGLDLLRQVREKDPTMPVIMITAYGEVETAVAAVRAGAYHFLEKPVELPEVFLLIEQALETRGLRGELDRYRAGHQWQFSNVTLVGRSRAISEIADLVSRLGHRGSQANILIRGESGTGKDLVARAIHARGPRRAQPFLDVNCTALPEHLVESELFGHEAGAFTGAQSAKRGLLEVAHKGTLFLDEIGDMPRAAQAKLLHFLETQTFRRVGAVRDIEVDVHVIAATNRDLKEAVSIGEFREDLFYRLDVVPILLPPLRERREDIEPLTVHFLSTLSQDMRQPAKRITSRAMEAIVSYDWPGNARHLRNVLERMLLFEDDEVIDVHHLPLEIRGVSDPGGGHHFVLPNAGIDLEDLEKDLIVQALRQTEGNKSRAARLLGLSRDTLRYRLEKYGVEDGMK